MPQWRIVAELRGNEPRPLTRKDRSTRRKPDAGSVGASAAFEVTNAGMIARASLPGVNVRQSYMPSSGRTVRLGEGPGMAEIAVGDVVFVRASKQTAEVVSVSGALLNVKFEDGRVVSTAIDDVDQLADGTPLD